MATERNNYVVGKGKLYFDMFATGTLVGGGERYFGNVPSLESGITKTTLDHFSSEGGVAVKDASVDIQFNHTGKFMTDNVSVENLALFFHGITESLTVSSATAVVETIKIKPGLFYQLGRTADMPSGVRNISNVVVKTAATTPVPIAATGNYEVIADRGRIFIEPDAPAVTTEIEVTVTYDVAAGLRDIVISKNQSVYGSLRYISDNPAGLNADYFYPYVKISADGTYSLIGDKWQEMSFSMDVLKLDDQTEALYIDGVPAP